MASGEKQGYLGSLEEKTLPELKDLLQRQQKIISQKQFVASLPDKGEKIKLFIKKLNQLISERTGSHVETPSCQNIKNVKQSVFESLRDKNVSLAQNDTSCMQTSQETMDVADDLSKEFERIAVSSKGADVNSSDKHQSDEYINSYNRVILKADQRTKRVLFKPNSTLKISNIEELPDKYKHKSKLRGKSSHNKDVVSMDLSDTDQKHSQPGRSVFFDESAVHIPPHKFSSARMISIEESIKLVDEQRKKLEELQTKQAADRLAARLHIKMDNYNPEGTDMNYRKDENCETDSDDEPEQTGYESND